MDTWVDNELNQFKGGNKDYRANAQQLVDQLKNCILVEAKYNSIKQTILSQADTGPTNSTTTFTFGLGGKLLSETNTTTNTQKDYVYLNGKPLAMIKHTDNAGTITSQIYTIHNDHLGTPQAMTNASGVTVWNASYGPFGKGTPNQDVNNDGNKVTLNIRFPGQYYDKEAGLHYNYFRVYDPNSGRYITSDPIGLRGGLNTFGYAEGNSINRIDVDGLNPKLALYKAVLRGDIHEVKLLLQVASGLTRRQAVFFLKQCTGNRAKKRLVSGGKLIGRAGRGKKVREVFGSRKDAFKMFRHLSQGGRAVTKPGLRGRMKRLPGGGNIIIRGRSKSGPLTIDINIPGFTRIRKIKFLD